MARSVAVKRSVKPSKPSYILDEQIGFILRQVWQRHATIFARDIGINLTPTQWAALAKLTETGPCSQNQLGRLTAMDDTYVRALASRYGNPNDILRRDYISAMPGINAPGSYDAHARNPGAYRAHKDFYGWT